MQNGIVGLLDLDGTLVLSEHLKMEAHIKTVEHFGGAPLPEGFEFPIGQSRETVIQKIQQASGLVVSLDEYYPVYRALYDERRNNVIAAPGTIEMLEAFKAAGVRLCIVTSSHREDMEVAVERAGIKDYFERFISADDVENRKPAPDPYLLGLKLMNADPATTFVIEDTTPGTEAGRAAGLKTFAIRRPHNVDCDLSAASDFVEESWGGAEIAEYILEKLN